MDSLLAGLIVVFGVVATVGGVIAVSVIINGYVLSILWAWFLVSLGLPALSVAHAIGVGMCVTWLTYTHKTSTEEDKSKALEGLFTVMILRPLIFLGIGYIVKQFM